MAGKRRDSKPVLDEWALDAATRRRSEYHSCHTCRNTQANDYLDEILASCEAAFDAVGAAPSLPLVFDKLRERVTYTMSETAMKSHVRNCRPRVYAKIWRQR